MFKNPIKCNSGDDSDRFMSWTKIGYKFFKTLKYFLVPDVNRSEDTHRVHVIAFLSPKPDSTEKKCLKLIFGERF